MLKKRMNLMLLGISGLAAASLAVGTVAHAVTPSKANVDDVLSVLQSEPQTHDESMAVLQGYDLPIDFSTMRQIGENEVGTYWVGNDFVGNICLIGHIHGGYEVAGSTCSNIIDFYNYGLGLSTTSGGVEPQAFEAYLLPDDLAPDQVPLLQNAETLSAVTTDRANFALVAPGSLSEAESVSLSRSNGQQFTFTPLQHGEVEIP